MGLSFKKFLEGAWAQVNPFDNGKTWGDVNPPQQGGGGGGGGGWGETGAASYGGFGSPIPQGGGEQWQGGGGNWNRPAQAEASIGPQYIPGRGLVNQNNNVFQIAQDAFKPKNVFDPNKGQLAQDIENNLVRQTPEVSVGAPLPEQQGKPGYGSGILGLVNRGRDIIDANTPQDQWNRAQNNQPVDYQEQQQSSPNLLNQISKPLYNQRDNQNSITNQAVDILSNPQNIINGLTNPKQYLMNSLTPYIGKGLDLSGNLLENSTKNIPVVKSITKGFVSPMIDSTGKTFENLSSVNRGINPYHGGVKEQIGQRATDTLNLLQFIPVGTGAKVTKEIAKGGSKLAPQVLKSAGIGGAFGGSYGAANAMAENKSPQDILKETLIGTGAGLALGGGIPLGVKAVQSSVKPTIKAISNIGSKISDNFTPLGQEGSLNIGKLIGIDKPKVSIKDKLTDSAIDTTPRPASDENLYGPRPLQKIGDKVNKLLGVDNQGGGIPNPSYDPLEALKAEARKYKSAEEFVDTNKTIKVPISDFAKTDSTSWNEAVSNVSSGKGSKTTGPVEVVMTPNGYKLVEGNHRAVQALNSGKDTIEARVISKEGLGAIAKRDGPHIKMGMHDSYTKQQLTDLYNEATKKKGFFTPMNQGGYVKVPGKGEPIENTNWRDSIDNLKFVKDDNVNANILSEKQQMLRSIAGTSRSDKELGDVLSRAEQLHKQGYLGDNANLAWDIMNNPASSSATKKRATSLYESITKPRSAAPIDKTPTTGVTKNTNTADDISNNIEKLILGDITGPQYKQSTLGTITEKLSPNKQIRKVTGAVEGKLNKLVRTSLESGNTIGRTPGRILQGVSRQSGRTEEELAQAARLQGGKQLGDIYGQKLAQSGDKASKNGIRKEAIFANLDPELNKARGGKDYILTEAEQAEANRLKNILDSTHEGQYKLGLLDDKTYSDNKGSYVPRDFNDFFNDSSARKIAKDNKLELNIFKKRNELSDIPKEVIDAANTDPYYLAALRVQQFEKNKAIIDHSNYLIKSGGVLDKPKKGYIQVPDEKGYGAIKGKYVLKEQLEDIQGFIYETNVAQQSMALLNAYDRNILRQGLKKAKTVYNPGVRLGNRTFNYLMSSLNGVNPITFSKNYAIASSAIKHNKPEYLEAVKQGIFGSSIVDKELYKSKDAIKPSGNILKKGDDLAAKTYSGVDDKSKLSMYMTFRQRGLSPTEAANRTRRAMQNYDMVGYMFDIGAKTPIGGNAFVRFSSELLRMAHNTAVDNPIRLAGAIAAGVTLVNVMSKMSGETPEDKKTREERVGAPRIPFTHQSLEVQTPYGAINMGRLLGVTTYNDLTGGFQEDIKRLLPFQSPVTTSKNGVKFNPAFVTSDPLIGPLIGQVIDKDFRGKSIKDPENNGQIREPLSTKDQLINRAKNMAMSYLPLANETTSIAAAAQGKSDYYGKDRSLAQALLRVGGIKTEKYGPEQAQKQRDTNEYFARKEVTDKEVAGLSPEDAEAYKRLTGYYKTRQKTDNAFEPGKQRAVKEAVYDFPENKWSDLASHLKTYDLIQNKKEKDAKAEIAKGKKPQPIQPEFDSRLSKEFRIQLITNKSQAPGQNLESDQMLYNHPEWDTYQKIKDEYKAKAKEYYPKTNAEYDDELVKHKTADYPTKGPAKQAYDNAFAQYVKGQGPKPEYTDAVNAEKEAYSNAKLAWTNNERKARGLSPISADTWNNVSFGFEPDEAKLAKELYFKNKGNGGTGRYGSYGGSRRYARGGGGSRGGGGGGSNQATEKASNDYKYTVKLNAGGTVAKPKVTVKNEMVKSVKQAKGGKGQAKAKVSLKKSRV